jgi:transcriptional regulator with XRE-family HTH domain
MARTKQHAVSAKDKHTIGALLRELRRGAGYRSVESAASTSGCPVSRQTIYSYERGGLFPSLAQFLDLVEFYTLGPSTPTPTKPEADLRAQGVAAVTRSLTLSAYHVGRAWDLIGRMQPDPTRPDTKRKARGAIG